jgi:hypothetical protein
MKKISLVLISFGFALCSNTIFAQGTGTSTPKSNQVYNNSYNSSSAEYSVTVAMVPGSMKTNIEHIAKDNGWTVVWKAPNDYNWTTYTKIREQSLVAVMKTILNDYPLQAIFYQGNRVLVIQARTVR